MHPTTLRDKLYGVIAFPITPFKDDLSLDLPGLHHNITKLIEHPICALVVAGGTGEMYSLTLAEYTRVVELTALAVEDRVPVIAGVGFNQRMGIEMAQAAEKAGADGILIFPPYYPHAEDEGLFEYYRSIAAAVKLGVLIYSRDWAVFSPSMVERLTAIPNLIAWKDGHGDIRQTAGDHESRRRSFALDWWRRRRPRCRLLQRRNSNVYFEHRDCRSATLFKVARIGRKW